MERDSKGRFLKGRVETSEEKLNRLIAIEERIHKRKNYIGDIKQECPRIYNVWRGIRFTEKGKRIGCSEEWNDFRVFYNDVRPKYKFTNVKDIANSSNKKEMCKKIAVLVKQNSKEEQELFSLKKAMNINKS